jgi:zinc/manganese transport system permease protein
VNWDSLDVAILGPAFLAGLLVLSTHVPLGQEVLRRGIIFIDLAVAQIAGLGVIAAGTFGWESHGWEVQVAAVGAALAGALLLHWTEKHLPEVQEAIIGVMFILAASAGVLLLANNPHGGEHLKELLVGHILWVTLDQLWPVALIYAVILGLWFGLRERLAGLGFYALFAVTVTVSVQLVGVYLVFSSLIIPALASKNLSGRRRLWFGYAVAVLGYLLGLILSALLDLPSGALVVWTLAMLAVVTILIGTRSKPV